MSAPGAPPPPPPPYPIGKGFQDLPAELLLDIIQYMRPRQWLSLALTIYPVFRRHGLAPALTEQSYFRIVSSGASDVSKSRSISPLLGNLPLELLDEVTNYLEPADIIAVILAHRGLLAYLPQLSNATRKRLWKWRSDD
ncbi:hypothetical protein B0J11DRAFT_98603 [Dendryphion nanum]|uniref:F-box domain-containing protein n=1 Tax=Dendryphion nanum TaxID=256645 RepID=A0A9P9DFK1_9PLEO|nr:hypothetical protein B0J11DRAFT_98603 [Dendryphion nanum]